MFKNINLIILSVVLSFAFITPSSTSAHAEAFRYVHPKCNFSIAFPEPPTVETIWADKPLSIPRINFPSDNGYRGEKISYIRSDFITGDLIHFEAQCISIEENIAKGLTKKGIMLILKDVVAQYRPQETRGTYFEDGESVKWGTVKAYVTDETKSVFFHTHHFLVGNDSMLLIRSWYTTGNPLFKMEYDSIQKSIILN